VPSDESNARQLTREKWDGTEAVSPIKTERLPIRAFVRFSSAVKQHRCMSPDPARPKHWEVS
jgi:hypothetical protein